MADSATATRETLADIVAERTRLRRQVRALTAGNGWLEKAAELFGEMPMGGTKSLMEAIGTARRRFLPEHLRDTPLSDIERCLYRQGMGAFVLVLVYELVSPAIVRQLEAMVAEMKDDPGAVERYAKAPHFGYGTPSTWPGTGAWHGKVT